MSRCDLHSMHDPLLNLTKKFRLAKATRNYARARGNSPRESISIEARARARAQRCSYLTTRLMISYTYTRIRISPCRGFPARNSPVLTDIQPLKRTFFGTAHTARLIPAPPPLLIPGLRSGGITGEAPSYAHAKTNSEQT